MIVFGNNFFRSLGKGKPSVGVIACLHGDEIFGLEVLDQLSQLPLSKGSLELIIGNPEATRQKKRFISSDLNRSFPGKNQGGYEERRANELIPILKSLDYVIDLHSSSSETPTFGIITKRTKKHKRFAETLGVKKIAFMTPEMAKGKALIDFCPIGISLEMGKHDSKRIVPEAIGYVKNLLSSLGMIGYQQPTQNFEYYEIEGLILKPENLTGNCIAKNFEPVEKGKVIFISGEYKIISEESFIPILAGEEAYPDLICLKGKKIDKVILDE